MENFSENKRSRGRPKCAARHFIELLPDYVKSLDVKSFRSHVNYGYQLIFLEELNELKDKDAQLAILGCTIEQIAAGQGSFPKGYKQAAEAAGRWIQAGNDPQETVEIMADARRRGISFADIAAHFRALRLGKPKEGNLVLALAQTIDRYRKQYPETPPEHEKQALLDLLELIG